MKRTHSMLKWPSQQRGISLIEVLITMLILAIGLLGLSALQLSSLKNNHSAMQRSIAVMQSYTLVEAIRADPDSAKAGRFNISFEGTPGSGSFPATVHTMWREQLSTNLGASAKGSVACASGTCKIIVQWDDSRPNQGGDIKDVDAAKTQLVTEVFL